MDRGKQEEIGRKLREERIYRNLNLKECAKILGVSSSFLGLLERGERSISLDRLVKFCSVFGVDADYILLGGDYVREDIISMKSDIVLELEGLTEHDYNILLSIIKAYKRSSENKFPYKIKVCKPKDA